MRAPRRSVPGRLALAANQDDRQSNFTAFVLASDRCPLLALSGHCESTRECLLSGLKRTSASAVELARCMSAPPGDQAVPLWRPPPYFDLARINLDSTTPAMMAPAITRSVVRSMFIDYLSSR